MLILSYLERQYGGDSKHRLWIWKVWVCIPPCHKLPGWSWAFFPLFTGFSLVGGDNRWGLNEIIYWKHLTQCLTNNKYSINTGHYKQDQCSKWVICETHIVWSMNTFQRNNCWWVLVNPNLGPGQLAKSREERNGNWHRLTSLRILGI